MESREPTPFGNRLTEALLDRIYRLAAISDHPISLDSTRSQEIYPPILQTSSHIRHHLLPLFLSENTFSLRRASLCAYQRTNIPTTTSPPHSDTTIARPQQATLLPAIPPPDRAQIRHLQLSPFNGSRLCTNAALGRHHRNTRDHTRLQALRRAFPAKDQQLGKDCCDLCNPFVFPNLLAFFPRLRSVEVDVGVNRDSELCWASFCRAVVQGREPVWVAWVGVGERVLRAEEGLGLDVRVVDGKWRRVWKGVRALERGAVEGFVRFGVESVGVTALLRISEGVALKLLALMFWFDCVALFGEGEIGGGFGGRESCIEWDLRAQNEESWGNEALTAFNWALQQWLKRGVISGSDYGYVRATEGGGVRDVVGAGRLEAALLDEFERLA